MITYFTLTFIEGVDFSVIVELLFGSQSDNYVNLHSLILIVGIMFIVHISDEIGTFQFLAVLAIKLSRGKPTLLMTIFCIITIFFSAILNNILTVMILIPLTITVSRVLNVDPTPYILTQAVLVNIGGTLFSISSIPNILIVTSANITFNEYFLSLGGFSIFVGLISILFFIYLYRSELTTPRKDLIDILMNDFDIWNVVQSKRLLYASIGTLILLMISFIVIPPDFIPPDMIAMSMAMVLTISSGFEGKEIIKRFDFELIFYLLGIFVIAGGMEIVDVIPIIGNFVKALSGDNVLIQIITILWVAAISSSMIDNIPITKVLIPIVDDMASSISTNLSQKNNYFYSLSVGANWGDNLTPLGDNILVLNIAEENNRPISMINFWKLGFTSTIIQLSLATIFFILMLDILLGLGIFLIVLLLLSAFIFFSKYGPEKVQAIIRKSSYKFRKTITN